jgi:carbamoyltransferase|tara:strand:- start:10190 stop:11875 length:1686 start_codon:yes stop_codon:yes gene_type:complete
MSVIVSVARGHNGSTTLLVDGKVVFYLEEERLSRFKYDGSPLLGIQKVFDYVDHIDHLVICHTHRHGPVLDWSGEDAYKGWARKLARKKFEFQTHEIDTVHHEMHAACGFYNSGFETAACVIADGAGSFLQIGDIQDTCYEFETIFNASYPGDFDTVYKHVGTKQSIGMSEPEDNIFVTEYPGHTKMYEAVTQYCGFPAIEAGKLMGLAPYGKPNEDLPSFFNGEWGNRNLIIPTYPNAAMLNVSRYDILKEDVKNHVQGEYTDVQKDLAYKIQEQTSDRMVQLIKKAHELTGEKNIVICGGYGLNCVANYKYWKEFPDLNIYCEPISHDGGTSIGGAKYVYNKLKETEKPSKQESVYYGPQYDPTGYMADLEGLEVTDTSYDDVAKLIREGTIVTIYQGRSEGGPRALGNRSILFDPTVKDGKDHVNAVKHREWFRPFACSIKKEAVHDWFDLAGRDETPHMMYAVKCHDGVEEKIPSVIHVDNTCRIQTVTPEQNEHYYNLIDAFDKIAGVPILFNTSFNLGGDPLVETIEDAVNTLNNSDIEWMYLPEIQKLVHVPNE